MSGTENWDTTKENIRPLRQGRPASAASFAEIPKTSAELKAKRDEFEEKIRIYKGDDPLGEWINYIAWVEASYPSGGSESGLGHLIKECCQEFYTRGKETKQYYTDERFVKLWIKMTATTPPLKTYAFMMKHQIGARFPEVYFSWAAELESVGNCMEAEKVLNQGIEACSSDPDNVLKLENQKKAMLDRDARSMMERGMIAFVDQEDEEREALGGLRPVGEGKNKAPINRVGDNKILISRRDLRLVRRSNFPVDRVLNLLRLEEPVEKYEDKGSDSKTKHRALQDKEKLTRGVVRPGASQQSSSMPSVQVFPENGTVVPKIHPDEVPFPSSEADRENYAGTVQKMRSQQKDPLAVKASYTPARPPLPELTAGFQILADPPENLSKPAQVPRLPIDHKSYSGNSPSRKHSEKHVQDPVSDVDWGDGNYKDFNPFKEPISDLPANVFVRPGEPAAPPQKGQLFMWSYQKFPSGLHEASFEENLALLYRKNIKSQSAVSREKEVVECKLNSLVHAEDDPKQLERLLAEREDALKTTEGKLREREEFAEQRLNAAAEALELAEKRFQELEEKERLVAEANERAQAAEIDAEDLLQKAHDVHREAEDDLGAVEGILSGMSSCLTTFHRDIVNDVEPLDALMKYSVGMQWRLQQFTEQDRRQIASVNMMLEVLDRTIAGVTERQARLQSRPIPVEESVPHPSDVDSAPDVPTASDSMPLTQGSGTSWRSSQPQTQSMTHSVSTNPVIKAMWNGTLNLSARDRSQAGSANVSLGEQPSVPEPPPEIIPIRQSLAVRKSGKVPALDASEDEDMENVLPPASVPKLPTAFQIFEDTPDQASTAENRAPSSPVSPPPGVLSKSQACTPEVCSSNSEDEENKPAKIVVYEEEPTKPGFPVKATLPHAKRRSTMRFYDLQDEFNITTRKSMVPGDQTIQLGSESQFFEAIDPDRRMASTPKSAVLERKQAGRAAEEEVRREPRQSYYPLSPIMEGSRENKTSSSSSGSVTSTNLKSKKSLGICQTLFEDEEHPIDPYTRESMTRLEGRLADRVFTDASASELKDSVPKIFVGRTVIRLEQKKFIVEELLGEGHYAQVYRIRRRDDVSDIWALKVQQFAGWWDRHIHFELIARVRALQNPEPFLERIIGIDRFYRLNDGASYTLLPLYENGTMVDLINAFQKIPEKTVPEHLAMKLAIDVLRCVEILHSVNIIHGDVKSDNFLIQRVKDMANARSAEELLAVPSVVITDFGCGIDMDLYDSNVTFSTECKKKAAKAGYEILQSKPWTFQIDFLGVLDVIHTLLFGEYMKVYQEAGVWKISKSFKRNWSDIWASTFHKLLNVPSCDDLPSISDIRREFEETALRRINMTDISRLTRHIRDAKGLPEWTKLWR